MAIETCGSVSLMFPGKSICLLPQIRSVICRPTHHLFGFASNGEAGRRKYVSAHTAKSRLAKELSWREPSLKNY